LKAEKIPSPTLRFELLDTARGLAVALMLFFHFCFDLNEFEYIQIDQPHHPFWLHLRHFIVNLFIAVSGASLALATRSGRIKWEKFLLREAVLVACAALVSIGSFVIFPDSWIFFGILHFMAAASLLAIPFLRLGILNLILGILLLVISQKLAHPVFDTPALQWLGLMTHDPETKDYAPLLPWFGVMLIGVFIGGQMQQYALFQYPLQTRAWAQPLLWLGRHSLVVYMLHQPVLFGIFTLLAQASDC
jgi:uncharacterized membrane protein